MSVRVLYSFPYRLGAGRICHTAYQQVIGASNSGAVMTVFAGSIAKKPHGGIRIKTTLSFGRARIPVKWIGRSLACDWHDRIVAEWLNVNSSLIDVVHGWPLASIHTIRVARKMGIPFLIERPNAHTRFAYETVAQENQRLGIQLPENHDHEFNQRYLDHEEEEYANTSYLLCPSEFVKRTFIDQGVHSGKLMRHHYGYDSTRFSVDLQPKSRRGIVMIYAGVCEPRKGLHLALDAWHASGAAQNGRLIVCGEFVPGYADRIGQKLRHPSVEVLGHREDLPELMRKADIFILPSLEEGSALVTYEARGSGCVLLVSDASGAVCEHGVNALVHRAGDSGSLARHIARLEKDRSLLESLRAKSIETLPEITWDRAGQTLTNCYQFAVDGVR